jgi:hypothetical protein
MGTLLSTEITTSLSQIVLALCLSSIVLLFGRVRLALFVIYCSVFYWIKPWNLPLFTKTTPSWLNAPECLFVVFCFFTIILIMMGLAFHRD